MAAPSQPARRTMSLERTVRAPVAEAWQLWTTKDGIERWMGPDGFTVEVRRLDLRPGGELVYTMRAVAPEQVDFMKKAGMPVSRDYLVTYTEVVPGQRLAYKELADFIPGVEAYEVLTVVDFDDTPEGVRMTVTFDAMHDERWTELARMGKESELGKLVRLLS